jgi:hypothetical protein
MDLLAIILLILLLCLLSFLGGVWTAVALQSPDARGNPGRPELQALRSALRLTTDAWYARQQLQEVTEDERRNGRP